MIYSDDYDLWSKALLLALQNRGLWCIVNGSETAPDASVDAGMQQPTY